MNSMMKAKALINDLFEEEALVIGGLVAIHEMDDDLVWGLVKSLDAIRGKILNRLADTVLCDNDGPLLGRPDDKPHPAIQEFLLRLRGA